MKLKRLISCGLVGILTGVGILMNAKVSSAEDKSVKYTIDSASSVEASGDIISSSNAIYKNTYAYNTKNNKEQITQNNSMTFTLSNLDSSIKISKIVMETHTNTSKGAGTIKITIGDNELYNAKYSKANSTTYVDYEFDVKELKGVEYMSGDISILMSCTTNSLYCRSYTIYYSDTTLYSVSFFDGTEEYTDLATKVDENGKLERPEDPKKDGYVFDGWYIDSEFSKEYVFDSSVTADLKLYAKFEDAAAVETCTVTFMKDAETAFLTSVVKKENLVVEPDDEPTKDGYSFGGWYKDVNCTTSYDFNTPVNEDTTLYAKWLAKYTVSFDTDGGSIVETQTVVTGNKATKPAVNPTKKGYNFAGWYTDNTYTTEFDFENTIITDNTTVYAKFEDASIFKLDGYTFSKINTLEELTTGYYVIGGYISNSNEYKYMISDMNTTKSFKSSDNPTEFYEIKLKSNSVTIKNSKNMYIISNTEKSVSLSEKEKTIFTPVVNTDGFKLKVTDSLNFQFNASAKIFKSYTSKQQDLVLFKAQNVKPFHVTFKGPNNEELNKEEMLPHQKTPEFEAPKKPGHKFMGWYKEGTDVKYDFTTELSEDTILVAKYEALTPAELFEELEVKNQLAYHWQTEDGTTYTIDNVSLRFGINLTEEMKSLEGVKFGAILAMKEDITNINLSEYAKECTSAAEVVGSDPSLKYLEFTNIASEGGMTSLRLDNLDSALDKEFVVVIYMEYDGKLYVTEQKIASVKKIANEYLDKKADLDLTDDQIKSLEQLSK